MATTAHDGRLPQAGGPDGSLNPAAATGRCVAAITAACASGRSAQNAARNCAGSTTNSTAVWPSPVGYVCWTSAGPRMASFEVGVTSPRRSSLSGANAATKTRPIAFFASVPTLLITAPPYEWPTSSTGPSIWSTTPATYAVSNVTPRNGIAGATTA